MNCFLCTYPTLHCLSLLISSYWGKFPCLPRISAYPKPIYFSRHLQCSVLHRAFPNPRDGMEFSLLWFPNVFYVSVLSLYFCMVSWVNLENSWPCVFTPTLSLFPIALSLVFYRGYLWEKMTIERRTYQTVIQFKPLYNAICWMVTSIKYELMVMAKMYKESYSCEISIPKL